ncbi:MAG: nucleotidyl transferase AbiEii/AbiGii toxin family protein [Actinomycetota bacterium]|nr:nucleotidyl transferase AbiEii/AbiGii toxin family protein [Actinomycetota bacterium]
MTPRTLPEKIIALDNALQAIPHAFGGALALAYYAEPRATVDIDINVFVREDDAEVVLVPLRTLGVDADNDAGLRIARDGQIRVWWDATPVDLFFSYDPFHDAAAALIRRVSFADTTIPVLAPDHLAVCKAVFDRPKDWVDIDAMLETGTELDAVEIIRWVQRIVGDDDPRYEKIVRRLTR